MIKDEDRPTLSKNITRIRKAKGFTQEQLAVATKLSKRMIAHYETNLTNPPIFNILAIADALDVSILELLGISKTGNLDLFNDIDMRTMKKILLISKLQKKDRATIYNMIDALLDKNKVR
jgi:transcriptional regulator with XRE-family HTH domain